MKKLASLMSIAFGISAAIVVGLGLVNGSPWSVAQQQLSAVLVGAFLVFLVMSGLGSPRSRGQVRAAEGTDASGRGRVSLREAKIVEELAALRREWFPPHVVDELHTELDRAVTCSLASCRTLWCSVEELGVRVMPPQRFDRIKRVIPPDVFFVVRYRDTSPGIAPIRTPKHAEDGMREYRVERHLRFVLRRTGEPGARSQLSLHVTHEQGDVTTESVYIDHLQMDHPIQVGPYTLVPRGNPRLAVEDCLLLDPRARERIGDCHRLYERRVEAPAALPGTLGGN